MRKELFVNKNKFIEVETANFISAYEFQGHHIEVDDFYQGGYEIFVDGKSIGHFSVENFRAADDISDASYEDWADDHSDDREPTVDELWSEGYLDHIVELQMWAEFHEEVELRVRDYLSKKNS